MSRLGALRRDRRGSAVVEFSIVAPVMCLFLVGAFDIGHTLYLRGTLQGIVQKTARDATLEDSTDSAAQTALDNKVRAQVTALVNNATIVFTRRFYRTFSDAAAAKSEFQPGSDTNHNGICDNNETYDDANGNHTLDTDGGDAGQGGAKDRTVYTVTVTYPRMFPLFKYIGGAANNKIAATTILENQPYSDQNNYGAALVGHCP